MATPTTAGLIVLKQPRTGSTWLKAELNALPGVFLRFEPLSDTRFNTSECAPSIPATSSGTRTARTMAE